MSGRHYAILEARGLVEAAGPDARPFLQGMVSADVDKLSPERALWAAFLTPQGKFLHEFFLTLDPGPEALNLAGRTGFAEIVELARRAEMAVGNDTGPMHLIAAAGCPCLVLYSAESDPARTAPRGEKVEILREASLADLDLGRVLAALDALVVA